MRWAAIAGPLSFWATWTTWQGPPSQAAPRVPTPMARPPTAEQILEQEAIARDLTARIQQAISGGLEVTVYDLLHAELPQLGDPIPDNPLVPGIGHIIEDCDETAAPAEPDWVFCPATGILRPGQPS